VERRRARRWSHARFDGGDGRRLGFALNLAEADSSGRSGAAARARRAGAAVCPQLWRSRAFRAVAAFQLAFCSNRCGEPLCAAIDREFCDRETNGDARSPRLAAPCSAGTDTRRRIFLHSRLAVASGGHAAAVGATRSDCTPARQAAADADPAKRAVSALSVAFGGAGADCPRLVGVAPRSGLGGFGQRNRRDGLRPGISDRTVTHRNYGLAVAVLPPQRDPRRLFVCSCGSVDHVHRRHPRICRNFLLFHAIFGAPAAVRIDAALTSIR